MQRWAADTGKWQQESIAYDPTTRTVSTRIGLPRRFDADGRHVESGKEGPDTHRVYSHDAHGNLRAWVERYGREIVRGARWEIRYQGKLREP